MPHLIQAFIRLNCKKFPWIWPCPSVRGWPLPLKPDKIARLRRPATAGHLETRVRPSPRRFRSSR
ncbi:hypothetical protein DMX02_25790 [Pseudomonas jessenii]|nr:hypothetical protein DMX02_25790 [Pseudomonas jessenii]